MITVQLARVARSDRGSNPTGLSVRKINGCGCMPLTKAASKRRRKRRGAKEYLAWLESTIPSVKKKIRSFFKSEALFIFEAMQNDLEAVLQVQKASMADIERILSKVDLERWTALIGIVEDDLLAAFQANAAAAFEAVRFTPGDEVVELVNEHAREWAAHRAAGLVGMRRNPDGSLVPNPNAKWAITETTRDSIRDLVADAVDEGWSVDTFKDELIESHAFSASRAETIARTELADAHVSGNLDAWNETGIVTGKQSILGSEHDLDDMCNDNAEEGPIPLDADFPSGHQGPPYHPNCVCDVVPIVDD
jgi:hypothetical protein